jgi:ribosomal protein S17
MNNQTNVQKEVEVLRVSGNTLTGQELRFKKSAKYEKKYRFTAKYMAHIELDEVKLNVGDTILIGPDKPRSAKKRWKFIKRLSEVAK